MFGFTTAPGARGHRSKRLGRGFSSGIGGRSTRGTKGQNARKSGNVRLGFEGGQTPLYRKVGKIGFNNFNFKRNIKAINIEQLNYYDQDTFSLEVLQEIGLVPKKKCLVKFIGNVMSKKITIHSHLISKGAKAAIEAAGGESVII